MDKLGLGSSQREKMDMVLEPMQVMIQLALLSHCQIGSKISVCNNILSIQKPKWSQGIVRYFNGDNKSLAQKLGVSERTLYRKLHLLSTKSS